MNKEIKNKVSQRSLKKIEEQLRKKYEETKKVEQVYHNQLHKKLPQDSKDAVNLKQSQDLAQSIEDMERKEIMLIEKALKRISEGTFGVCLGCGQPIPAERLKAIPYTEYCVVCKAEKEED